ncbi:MAG TPA: hypothetical protein VI233_15795, partial [Puia sp.]
QNLSEYFHQWLTQPGHPNLKTEWNYDNDKKELSISFTQTNEQLFEFPLEYTTDGALHKIDIKGKTTVAHLPLATKPTNVTFDPNVNALVTFN